MKHIPSVKPHEEQPRYVRVIVNAEIIKEAMCFDKYDDIQIVDVRPTVGNPGSSHIGIEFVLTGFGLPPCFTIDESTTLDTIKRGNVEITVRAATAKVVEVCT